MKIKPPKVAHPLARLAHRHSVGQRRAWRPVLADWSRAQQVPTAAADAVGAAAHDGEG